MSAAGRLVLDNLAQFHKELEKEDKARIRAGQAAAKVEGFRLKKVLARELRSGAPGGHHLAPLRKISTGGRKRNPLSSFAKAVRYHAVRRNGKLEVSVGFMVWRETGDRTNADGTPYMRLSSKSSGRNWVKKAALVQEGFSFSADAPTPVGASYRVLFRRIGSRYSNRAQVKRYYFLRHTTKELKVPARPMIAPFWSAHRAEAGRNIINNFKRKMRGERI